VVEHLLGVLHARPVVREQDAERVGGHRRRDDEAGVGVPSLRAS
jgi:hypothetical protein